MGWFNHQLVYHLMSSFFGHKGRYPQICDSRSRKPFRMGSPTENDWERLLSSVSCIVIWGYPNQWPDESIVNIKYKRYPRLTMEPSNPNLDMMNLGAGCGSKLHPWGVEDFSLDDFKEG